MSFLLQISNRARWYFQSVENFGEVMFHQHVCITSCVLVCKMPNEAKNSPCQSRKKDTLCIIIFPNDLSNYDWCVQVAAHSNVTFEIITLEEVGRRSMETMTMDDDEMGTAYSTMNSSGRCPRFLCVIWHISRSCFLTGFIRICSNII